MRLGNRAAATAFEAVARTFGEAIRIEPMVASEYATAVPDPGRPVKEARATVTLTPSVDNFDGARQGTKLTTQTRFAQREARIWFAPDAYAAIGYVLRVGDRIVLIDRDGTPVYRVSRDPVSSDRGDVSVNLVEEAG